MVDPHPRLAAFFENAAHAAIAVYLFGSVARGDATATSDIDVAVLFDQAPEPALSGAALTLVRSHLRRHDRPRARSQEARTDRHVRVGSAPPGTP